MTFTSVPPGLTTASAAAGHGGRGDRHDQLHVGIDLQDRLRLGKRLVAVVVARPDRDQLQSGIFLGEPLALMCSIHSF